MVVQCMPDCRARSAGSNRRLRQKIIADFAGGFFQRNAVGFLPGADVGFFNRTRNAELFRQRGCISGVAGRFLAPQPVVEVGR